MTEYVNGLDDKVYRILLIASIMGIKEYPGFEDLDFNRLSHASLRKQLSDEEIHVLYDLFAKRYPTITIKDELIRQVLALVKQSRITKVKGYEDINFAKANIAKYSLREMFEHELIALFNQVSEKSLPVNRVTFSPIKEAIKMTTAHNNREGHIPATLPSKENAERDILIEDILNYAKELNLEQLNGLDFRDHKLVCVELCRLNLEELENLLSKVENFYEQQTEINETINNILFYAEEKNVISVEGVDFYNSEIAKEELKELSLKELQTLLIKLENIEQEEIDESVEGRILHLVKTMGLFSLPGFENINFRKLTRNQLSDLSENEITSLATKLEEMYLVDFLEEEADVINPLEVINRYRDGALKEEVEEKPKEELWRKYVPTLLKQRLTNWRTERVELFYEQAKQVMEDVKGTSSYRDIYEFVIDLSQVVFEEKQEENDREEEEFVFNDSVEESIMSIVEMIILPHLEVLDRIENKNGKIMFSNVWNVDFTEKLKQEVLDRDNWRCVVCEAETHLHVHHKIPRRLGGVHHKDNLVTLCASCHAAVETADVKKAFQKCLANFKKNKFRSNRNILDELSKDKTLLKQEVEQTLDKILVSLNNKGEEELMGGLIEVMNRLEVIFYE